MTKKHIHLYDAVRLAYPTVRRLLMHHADEVLQVPLEHSLAGLHDAPSALEFHVAGVSLAKEVVLHVGAFGDVPGRIPMGTIELRWEPTDHTMLFPLIEADLEVEPIDHERTMVSLLGRYQPPLGKLGEAIDRLIVHRMAERAFDRFFRQLLHEVVRDVYRLGLTDTPDEPRSSVLTGRA